MADVLAHTDVPLARIQTSVTIPGNSDAVRRALTSARRLARVHGNPYRRLELDLIELQLHRREGAMEGFAERLEAVQDRASALSAASILSAIQLLRRA